MLADAPLLHLFGQGRGDFLVFRKYHNPLHGLIQTVDDADVGRFALSCPVIAQQAFHIFFSQPPCLGGNAGGLITYENVVILLYDFKRFHLLLSFYIRGNIKIELFGMNQLR
jgi:hypothetical protein